MKLDKVLFLDIDGVANCQSTFTQGKDHLFPIDPYMAFLIGKIQLDTGCEIVLSSSWKHLDDAVEIVNQRIAKIYDKTPNRTGIRGNEVRDWLKKHPEVKRYAILDDNSDFYKYQPLFQTEWETGLTEEIANKVTEYLNK